MPAEANRPVPGTIFALSSGAPPAGVAVVRISGPEAGATLDALSSGRRPVARRATLRTLIDPVDSTALDRALLLWLPGPGSATGEDMAELHLHGGRAVTAAVLAVLARRPGLRPAEAGEFTRRAFENGRIDLNEAEALADLLAAESEAQRRNAMILAEGALSRAIARWQATILALSARLEAQLDFSDEDDVAAAVIDASFMGDLAELRTEIERWRSLPPVERLRDGVRVVLAGPPNAGKSTLLNALVGREAAIVTPIAGTTRDLIEAPVALEGLPFLFTDTAGLHDSSGDEVERLGIELAGRAIAAADLILWLGPPDDAPPGAIRIGAKSDQQVYPAGTVDISLSAHNGQGIAELTGLLVARAGTLLPAEGEAALSVRQRNTLQDLSNAVALACEENDMVLIAEALRLARAALDRLTGRAGTEEMLAGLFGRFCIGK